MNHTCKCLFPEICRENGKCSVMASEEKLEACSLADCPPGPFLFGDTLGFKTEYGATIGKGVGGGKVEFNMTNWPDAYVMASGEFFWGDAMTHEARAKLLVVPIDADELLPKAPSPSVGVGELREKIARIIDPDAINAGWDHERGAVQNDIDAAAKRAFAKADAILAALSSIPVGGLENRGSVVGSADALSALPRHEQSGPATPSTCALCVHWQAADTFRETVPYGRCARIIHSTSICDEAVEPLRNRDYEWDEFETAEAAALNAAKAFCVDGSGYHAALYTASDFGCTLFSPPEGVAIKPEADGEVSKATQSLQTTEPKNPSTPPSEAG